MKPKVKIGIAYERKYYEWRNRDGEFRSLRPAISQDAEVIQRALLGVQPSFFERLIGVFRIF